MSPKRTSAGMLVLEIDWTASLGFRIDRSAETKVLREYNALVALLWQLRQNGQVDTLRAFAEGHVSIAELKQAQKSGRLKSDTLLDDMKRFAPLWTSIDSALPRMGKSEETRGRYYTSLNKLRRLGKKWLGPKATIRDLERVPWRELREKWVVTVTSRKVRGRTRKARQQGYVTVQRPASAADWNHLGRALSAFLSVHMGDVYHPLRRSIMKAFDFEQEVPRKPVIARGGLFWQIVNAAPEHAQPCYIVLGCSGMRVGEYLRCTEKHVVPDDHAIDVPGGKTGAKRYHVAPEYWEWVKVGVPSPLKYRWLYTHFKRAAKAVGHPELRPHDLRHLFIKVAKQEGVPTTDTQVAVGQKSSRVTAGYEVEDVQAEVAAKVGRGLTRRRVG